MDTKDTKWTVRTWTATFGLIVPAVMALALSADTSFRFMGKNLKITNLVERGVLCGTAEAAIVSLCLYSWATGAKGAAWLAYAAVLVQSVPAFQVSGGYGGMVRTALGPVLLAILLHLLLGLELRMSRQKTSGLVSSVLREARERVTSYFGIGRRGEDSAAIARSRAADRAVALADKVASAKQGKRHHARLTAALADSIDRARHGLDAQHAQAAESAIVSRVVRRKSVAGLSDIEGNHLWTESASKPQWLTDNEDTASAVGMSVSELMSAPDSPPDTMTWTAPDTTDKDTRTEAPVSATVRDSRTVRNIRNGSMSADVRQFLTDNPDATDGQLADAMSEKWPDKPWNSIYKARVRYEDKIRNEGTG